MNAVKKKFGDGVRELAFNARHSVRKTPLTLVTGQYGGYLVPEEMQLQIDEGFQEVSVFGATAWNVPMKSETLRLPRVDITASHATGDSPLFGGMTISWQPEAVTINESEPRFADNVLTARNLEVLVYASNQLVADGGEALAEFLTFTVTGALAFAVDYACFRGNGASRPLGVLNSPATKQVTRSNANHISQADIANMVSALIPACFARAVFCCSVGALADICNLSSYMANPVPSGPLVGSLFGRPLYVTEKLPALGTSGDLLLMDPKLYALGFRLLEMAKSDQILFFTNQTAFRFIWRGDGQPLVKGTATLADGSTTAGVFVTLT